MNSSVMCFSLRIEKIINKKYFKLQKQRIDGRQSLTYTCLQRVLPIYRGRLISTNATALRACECSKQRQLLRRLHFRQILCEIYGCACQYIPLLPSVPLHLVTTCIFPDHLSLSRRSYRSASGHEGRLLHAKPVNAEMLSCQSWSYLHEVDAGVAYHIPSPTIA